MSAPKAAGAPGPVPGEIVCVWLLLAVVALEIVVTYARIPAHELYHVSNDGLAGGLGRALVFLNFPAAIAAVAVVLVLFGRLDGRLERGLAVASIALCAVLAWPGVVEQADLDPKPVNAVPALGILLAVVLTVLAARERGVARLARDGLRWRLPVALVALVLSLPWLAAELGVYLDGAPGLSDVALTGELRSQPGDPQLHPAVHHGHHHGMDGTLLVLIALLLAPTVADVSRRLRPFLAGYLALMFCYGLGNLVNDIWLEQVVKRGWTSWEVPGVTVPRVNGGWGVILLGAVIIWLAWRALSHRRGQAAAAGGLAAPD